MKNGQFPAILPLASLNGQNGFKIDGETIGDDSGYFFSAVGDVNSDGFADLLIGAFGHGSAAGRSYVIFGASPVGGQGLLSLASLNGTNGFKLDGEMSNDWSGYGVSAAGDVNGDGHADLLIGARGHASNTGRGYVMFGAAGIGRQGLIPLSVLNGTNGFKLDGEMAGDYSSSAVSVAGDVNGDGYVDLLIWAPYHPGATGRSYLVFGGPEVGHQGLIPLSSLNGTNGFKLDGEVAGDNCGSALSAAGDINGDGYADLLLGSYFHASNAGRSYVVFGGPGVGRQGLIPLSSLNGTNGFKLDGEAPNDNSGSSVSAAGDVNGDGYSDLLIGAWGHSSNTGRSYVVFGGPGVGRQGLIPLSSLNGTNGFKLDGEATNDGSGFSVGAAGDVNGDGYADLLIGAPYWAGSVGRSYVVFGRPGIGNTGALQLSSLDGVNGFKLDGEASNDDSGYPVRAAGDINGDGVGDILIGAYHHSNSIGRSYVVFGDIPPVLVNNSLSLSVGAAIQVNTTYLAVYDRNHNNTTLVFVSSAVTHGQFEIVGAPGVPLVNFTQQQVTNGMIQFVHDGSLVAPSYNITVRSTGIAWTGPSSARITFIGTPQSYFPAILPLGSLNGQNGFKLDGNNGDTSGNSVSTAGDINGDGHTDLLIGANGYPSGVFKGRSYVLFGGPGVGMSNNGILALSGLNGINGFQLVGENNKDDSSGWVSAAGDINGDGHDDLLIGAVAYPTDTYKGRSYVVFGGPGVGMGNNGILALSGLNGTNGFKLDGENIGDASGISVSATGDINGDGVADLIIGAWGYPANNRKGRSYVVFGGSGVGSSGDIAQKNLNGTNGFKLDGENNGDESGVSVSAVGDINGDGYKDLMIGACGYPGGSNKGRSYVVFGSSDVSSHNGTIALSNLNGTNGFKLNGENNNDYSGYSVSTVGDINGDGYNDLLIGAYGYPKGGNTGRSYVVFGGSKLGSSGTIALSSLNGTNGFKLDGENNGDLSGYSVSAAGDVNADGYYDLLVGAQYYTNNIGRTYVIFGDPWVGRNGTIALSSLKGVNGFKLDGENSNDYSGASVSAAGDINGDSVDDLLIGAYGYPQGSRSGRTYVVFGDVPPTLAQNRLSLYPGLTVRLNSSFLAAYDRNQNNNTLTFFPTNITHGYFASVSQPGVSLVNFTQPQLLNNTIQFVHDGSSLAPNYLITVRSAGIAWTGPHAANITFLAPMTTTSPPSTTSSMLTTTSTPTPVVTSTSTSTVIQTSTPVVTTTSTPTPTPTITPTPTPISAFPVLLNNQLSLNNGETVILSTNNLKASEVGLNNSQLVFSVGNVQNGYFSTTPSGNSAKKNLTTFTQSQIQGGAVEFVHASNNQAPSYSVIVSDGVHATLPSAAAVNFAGAPIITQNTVNITTGDTVTLTPDYLNLIITDGSAPSQVILTVNNLQHATITSNVTGMPVNNFTLAQLQAGQIKLTQDGSLITPSYTIIAYVPRTLLSSAPDPATVLFSDQGVYAPQLVNNYLEVIQGRSTTLSNRYLSAMEPHGGTLANNTIFYVKSVTHGHFSLIAQPQWWISSFNQNQLSQGEVQFIHDGSFSLPSYDSAVQAFGLQSASQQAGIFFHTVNQSPQLVHPLTDQIAVVGQPFSYDISNSFMDPNGDVITLLVSRFNSNVTLPSWLHFSGLNNRFTGIPTGTDFIDINVTAQDTQGLAMTTDFTLTISTAPENTGYSTIQKAIIGAVVSGTVGLFFAALQVCLKRAANKKLLHALGEDADPYDLNVVRPVAKEIAQRVKITGFMNATTNGQMVKFKGAVRSLLTALDQHGVDLNFTEMKATQKDAVINEIGNQVHRWVKAHRHGCTACCPSFTAFFKPQLNLDRFQDAANEIAEQVAQVIKKPQRLSASLSISDSPVFKDDLPRKQSVELLPAELVLSDLSSSQLS